MLTTASITGLIFVTHPALVERTMWTTATNVNATDDDANCSDDAKYQFQKVASNSDILIVIVKQNKTNSNDECKFMDSVEKNNKNQNKNKQTYGQARNSGRYEPTKQHLLFSQHSM